MLTVNLDGQVFEFDSGAKNIGEVIEYAKNGIEKDKLIADIKLSGRDLSGMEYKLPLRAHKDAVLEISTQTKSEFVRERMNIAGLSLDVIIARLELVPPSFAESGVLAAANHLAGAVNDFQFFLGWFAEVLDMDKEKFATLRTDMNSLVMDLKPVLQEMVKYQTDGDWESIGRMIDSKVVPMLTGLSNAISDANV